LRSSRFRRIILGEDKDAHGLYEQSFYYIFCCVLFLLCWESIHLSVWIWRQDISSLV
jgi:hypothetical protein